MDDDWGLWGKEKDGGFGRERGVGEFHCSSYQAQLWAKLFVTVPKAGLRVS